MHERVNGKTDLYSEPTDCHQFVEFNSALPIHIKKSIVYNQGLRIERLCSSLYAFEKNTLRVHFLGLETRLLQETC